MESIRYPLTPSRLNVDVLREVALWACPDTAVSLMYTARFLYHPAAKSILYRKPVYIDEEGATVAFFRFLLADGTVRVPYVGQLHIHNLHGLSPETSSRLIELIPSMVDLYALSINDVEATLTKHPRIYAAIAGLRHLQILEMVHGGHRTCDLLRDMTSSHIREIRLNWSTYHLAFFETEMSSEDWPDYHPIQFLKKWAASLEELGCLYWFTGPHVPVFTQIYPKMRSLCIDGDWRPLVAPYIRAYPNLTQLSIRTDFRDDFKDPAVLQHRELNIRSQLAADGPGTWRGLDTLTGSLIDLYMLGLTCRASRVCCHTSSVEEELHFSMLSAILSYAKPLHLKVENASGTFLHNPSINLPSILQGPEAAHLESLAVSIHLRSVSRNEDIVACLVLLASALKRLPLRRLRLRVITRGLDPNPKGLSNLEDLPHWFQRLRPPPPSPLPLTVAEQSLKDFDVQAYTRGLAEDIPTLTDAVVRVNPTRGSHRCLRAVIPDGPLPKTHEDFRMYEV